MKRFALVPMAVGLLALAVAADQHTEAPDGTLAASDRTELIELLEDSRTDLESLAAQATGEMWSKKPAADQWSVGEVVEHVVLAEEGIFALAVGALDGEENATWQEIAAATSVADLVTGMKDRSQKFPAPAVFEPKGEASRDEILARYAAARMKTLDFVRTTHDPIKRYTATGPPGTMNVQQWIALIGAHNLRHDEQIREVLEAIGG